MPHLFSYGTLQHEDVQFSIFNRTLAGREDYLLGYRMELTRVADPDFARTRGKAHHSILRAAANDAEKVQGTVFEVTDAELELADSYEPAEYMRVLGKLASGGQAWVYVEARPNGKNGLEHDDT